MVLLFTNTQLLSSPDVNWWTGVVWITCGLLWCFYQLFGLSFWRHPFTAEHPLLRQWWNATFLQIWWRNKLIYILDGLRMSTFSLWVNYSFKHKSHWMLLDLYLIIRIMTVNPELQSVLVTCCMWIFSNYRLSLFQFLGDQ